MASLNKVFLVGNLTRDPEVRYTAKGTAIAKLGMAVNRTWTTETGEKKEEVTFVDIDVFGRSAENVGKYLRKGSPLLVEGRLRLDTWEDKQTNQKRSKLGVVAERTQFLGSPQGAPRGGTEFRDVGDGDAGGASGGAARETQAAPAAEEPPAAASTTADDDNLPF
jgi:single-strand DNA-binding protein